MKICNNIKLAISASILLWTVNLASQDLHYSQFYNSPINVNPASTGIFNGDQRYMVSFRDQWRSVPVPWLTFSGSYDQRIMGKNPEKAFWGLGFLMNYDRQGDSKLDLTNFNISASYTRILNPNHLLTFGLLAGYGTRGFNTNLLTWDRQWDGFVFDPGAPSGEDFDFLRVHFMETAGGINYRWQKSSRTRIDLGASAFHFIQPKPNFSAERDLALPLRFAINGVANLQLTDLLDIQIHALQQFQRTYRETVLGALAKIYISDKRGEETVLHIGAGYRTTEALFPTFALEYKNIYVGISYDVDFSDFNNVTNNRGGPEVHFRYTIKKVKPLGDFKVCPIY
ncbi:MAG TPA: PorP/SprF family type IX secretion system membrane protein [Saprospiraceae bacterium]|nr:PorP/SprF family type IX secretion system membrane protein [Saprospiraceae bacterium]